MPIRIPDDSELGKPGSLRPQRGIATISGESVGGAVAEGLGKVGGALAVVGEAGLKERDALDVIKADALHKTKLTGLERDFDTDPEFDKYPEKFDPRAAAIDSEAASIIRNPRVREKFAIQRGLDTERSRERVLQKGTGLAREHKEIEVEDALRQLAPLYTAPDATPEQREQALKSLDDAVTAGEQTGLLRPRKAQQLRDKYVGGAVLEEAEAKIWSDPDGLLDELQGTTAGCGELPKFSGKRSRGYWGNDPTWSALDGPQKAAAMSLLEADTKSGRIDFASARNALGAMVNRADKEGVDLGQHVSGKIYQPTIEPEQYARLAQVVGSEAFWELTELVKARQEGKTADWVDGATHFLAHPKTMLALEAREPNKYRSWRGWTGFDERTGTYKDQVLADGSHAFLAPEGRHSASSRPKIPGEQVAEADTGTRSDVESGAIPDIAPKNRYGRLTPTQRHALITRAKIAQSQLSQRAIDEDIERIRDTGQPIVELDGRTSLDRAMRVLQPNQWHAKRMAWDEATLEHSIISPLKGMSADEGEAHLARNAPDPTDPKVDYKAADRVSRKADLAWRKIREERAKDPAFAVEKSPEVSDAYQMIAARNPEVALSQTEDGSVEIVPSQGSNVSPQRARQVVIEARLEAQRRLGIDSPKAITRREASNLIQMPDPESLSGKEYNRKAREAADRAYDTYGSKYAEAALKTAFRFQLRDKENSDMHAGLLTKLARGERVTANEISRLTTLQEINIAGEAFFERPTDRFGALSDVAPERPMALSGDRPAISPSLGMPSSASDAARAAGEKASLKPNQQQLEWVQADPESRQPAFDLKFGKGAYARAIEGLKKKK